MEFFNTDDTQFCSKISQDHYYFVEYTDLGEGTFYYKEGAVIPSLFFDERDELVRGYYDSFDELSSHYPNSEDAAQIFAEILFECNESEPTEDIVSKEYLLDLLRVHGIQCVD